MLVFNYATKEDLKACVGRRLAFIETSILNMSYEETGELIATNDPVITKIEGAREFAARVTMEKGLIKAVNNYNLEALSYNP